MNEVVKATNEEITRIPSREVAKMMEISEHKNLLRKIDQHTNIFDQLKIEPDKYWIASTYKDAKGEVRKEYQVSKKGCEFLAHKTTGEKGDLFTVKYMERFEEMEKQLNEKEFKLPGSYKEALQQLIEKEEEKEKLQLENREKDEVIKSQTPKVIFADAVSASHTSILVGDLAKLLKQNGVETGQNRLFDWLRDNGYLIRRKGSDYNMPTQRSNIFHK